VSVYRVTLVPTSPYLPMLSMLAKRPTVLALLASGLVLGVASAPSAQTPQPNPALNGTWQLQGSLEDARQIRNAAIRPAVAALTPDIQRMARARIAESTAIPTQIQIAAQPNLIHLQFTGEDNHTFESAPGASQNVFSRSGVRAQLTQTYRPDGGIEQRFRAIDGTQWNFLTPQADGRTMHLDVLMRSRRLSQDIRFRLVFTKSG